MSIDSEHAGKRLDHMRDASHADCVACSTDSVLGLRCSARPDGSVATVFQPAPWMAGYDGLLHGGIVAAALDAAATQCLFAHGIEGLTALLRIRYRRPAPS